MGFAPKQHYVAVPQEVYRVYFRNIDGTLGVVKAEQVEDHKDAILEVKELLVKGGDCLTNKAVLALVHGGKKNVAK